MRFFTGLHLLLTLQVIHGKRTIFKMEVTDEEDGDLMDMHIDMEHPMTGSSVKAVLKQRNDKDFDVSLNSSTFILKGIETKVTLNGVVSLGFLDYGYQINASLTGKLNDNIPFEYNLKFDRQFICPHFDLFHELLETQGSLTDNDDLFSFKSSLKTDKCKESDGLFSYLTIDVDLDWRRNYLIHPTKLRQLFVFEGDSGYESMNMSSPMMDINVTADWIDNETDFKTKKKAVFKSNKLLDWLPSFQIDYLRNQEEIMLSLIRGNKLKIRDEL